MVQTLLLLKANLSPDSADALAVAICHAHYRTVENKLLSQLVTNTC